MEDKLNEFRLRKRRQEKIHNFKEKFLRMFAPSTKDDSKVVIEVSISWTRHRCRIEKTGKMLSWLTRIRYFIPVTRHLCKTFKKNSCLTLKILWQDEDVTDKESITSDTEITEEIPPTPRSWLTYITWLVYFLIWATLYAIAIELKFGIVFFMFSALIGICLNTRVKPRGKKEASAYSVFNENCESIDGTFKAEMFERQLGLRQL